MSEELVRELREAPRYIGECCGHRTLPNHISLAAGRANFRRFGACDERSREAVVMPGPKSGVRTFPRGPG